MSIRVSELAVEGEGGDVTLRAGKGYDSDIVRVTWMCGDSREFTRDALKGIIGHLDKIEKAGLDDVWVALNDRSGRQLVVRIAGGYLYADTSPGEPVEDANRVDWSTLKKGIRKSL